MSSGPRPKALGKLETRMSSTTFRQVAGQRATGPIDVRDQSNSSKRLAISLLYRRILQLLVAFFLATPPELIAATAEPVAEVGMNKTDLSTVGEPSAKASAISVIKTGELANCLNSLDGGSDRVCHVLPPRIAR